MPRQAFQMRLSDEDQELFERLEKIYGVDNRSKLVRMALEHILEHKPELRSSEIFTPTAPHGFAPLERQLQIA